MYKKSRETILKRYGIFDRNFASLKAIQSATEWVLFAFQVHRMQFRLRLSPTPQWEAFSTPQTLVVRMGVS